MTVSKSYATTLEKKLISEFKEKFKFKMGYEPIVITNIAVNGQGYRLMTLPALESQFESFLPVQFGRKLALTKKCRKRELVELRMMFCFIARTMKYTYAAIGEYLNGRDHTTVIHNINTFQILLETSESFREKYNEILTCIKQNNESPALEIAHQVQDEPEHAVLS